MPSQVFCNSCNESKPSSEFYVRSKRRTGFSCYCKPCTRIKQRVATRKWYKANTDKAIKYMRLRREDEEFRERERQQYRSWYQRNAERERIKAVEWKRRNPDRARHARSEWFARNPHKRNEARSRGYAARVQATPAWADREEIQKVYKEAKQLEEETGVRYSVDHIVPIKSGLVCGLHNEFNLQPMPLRDNQRKQNLTWPDMP